jgi:hypothetical protein
MRNPSVRSLSVLKLHACGALHRMAGAKLEPGAEPWQAKRRRRRHELRTELFQVAKIH